MNKIKMSVIVPTHGRVSLFKETLKSLLMQTSKEFEIIVTDDSSKTEEQMAIKKLVEDARITNNEISIKYIFSVPNLLQSKNTNQGLENASGEYLRILHSDDILAPNCIETEIEAFEENPDCYFLNHSAKLFSKNFDYNKKEKIFISKFNIFDNWLKCNIFTGCMLPTSLAFRREVYLNIGGLNEKYKFLCDWDFFFRMILNEYLSCRPEALFISGSLVGWRQHNESITSTMSLTHFYEHKELIDNIIEIYKARKILSKKDLKYAIQKSIDYRYNRLIEDYEKYGNFTLPHVPLKYLKKEKYAKVSRNFAKFLKHFKTFCKPLTNFINGIVQPFSILYYLVSLIFSFILFLIGKKEV